MSPDISWQLSRNSKVLSIVKVKDSKYLNGVAELGVISAEDNQVGSLHKETHALSGSLISKVEFGSLLIEDEGFLVVVILL